MEKTGKRPGGTIPGDGGPPRAGRRKTGPTPPIATLSDAERALAVLALLESADGEIALVPATH